MQNMTEIRKIKTKTESLHTLFLLCVFVLGCDSKSPEPAIKTLISSVTFFIIASFNMDILLLNIAIKTNTFCDKLCSPNQQGTYTHF